MPTWADLADQNEASLALLTGDAARRSHVSRAYYACYSLVTACLVARKAPFGVYGQGQMRSNPAHRELRRLVSQYLGPELGSSLTGLINAQLNVLYKLRLQADYEPARAFGLSEVQLATQATKKLFGYLRSRT